MPSEAPTSSKPVSSTAPSDGSGDIRRSRVYVLSRGPVFGLVRRILSVVALMAADVAGLALGVYMALVLRSIVYGDTVYWSLLWDTGPAECFPSSRRSLLVFLQAGLYAPREHRAGSGRVLAGLVLVALIASRSASGRTTTTTTGLIPTAVAASAVAIGLLRAAYDSVSLELMGLAGVRRRMLLVGEGDALADLERQLRASRGGIGVEVVGTPPRCRAFRPGRLARPARVAARARTPRRARAGRGGVRRADRARRRPARPPSRREGEARPTTTELLVHEGEYVPGQGVPLFELRPPMLTGLEWATKRAFDLVVCVTFVRGRHPALAPDRRRDQARLARAGPLCRPPHRSR